MDTKQIIAHFNMQHNDAEGGYYVNTFESPYKVGELTGFPPVSGQRTMGDSIYYLLAAPEVSCMHKVTGDMVYNFYSGDPVEMLILYPEGYPTRSEIYRFSNDLDAGGSPMKHIPGGAWLGSRVIAGGKYALMGVVMVPGFNPADYTIAKRADLISQYPEEAKLIVALTKE